MNYNLRVFLRHFIPARIVRFVKVFGVAEACRQVGREIGQLVNSVMDGESNRPWVAANNGEIEEEIEPNENVTVSVAIPVKDAGEDFRLLLSSLNSQKGFKKVEIIVVDSGSEDGSVATAHDFGAKVVQIFTCGIFAFLCSEHRCRGGLGRLHSFYRTRRSPVLGQMVT